MELINRERVADLLCGALEGGSNYWYNLPDLENVMKLTKEMKGQPIVDRIITAVYDHGASIEVYDIEEYSIDNENTPLGYFNLESIKSGGEILFSDFPSDFADILKEQDDAGTADIWFQLCIMGKVRYS